MNKQNFQIMRFQILTTALNSEFGQKITDEYAYAWDTGVYPFFNDSLEWHEPFADHFDVSKDMMDELSGRLDKAWNVGQGTAPTFYDLEAIYLRGNPNPDWSRPKLIHAMRYLALSGRFDTKFFGEVIANSGAPAEANDFARPMNRESDLFLC